MKCKARVRVGLAVLGLCAVVGLLPARAQAQGDTYYSWMDRNDPYHNYCTSASQLVRLGDGNIAVEGNYALKADGTVWFVVYDGALLDEQLFLDRVPGVADIVQLNASGGSYAIKRDGTVVSWSQSHKPETWATRRVETVPGLTGIVAVVGEASPMALKSDGTVWVWGVDLVGAESTTNRSTPVQVPGLTNVTGIGAVGDAPGWDRYIRYALKLDGTVWAWGYGYFGNGTLYPKSAPQLTPVLVQNLSGIGVRAICGEMSDSYTGSAIKNDGTALAWGGSAPTPVPLCGKPGTPLEGVTKIECGRALKTGGTVSVYSALIQDNGFADGLSGITDISMAGFLRHESPIEVGAQIVSVPEGGTATMTVRLGAVPTGVRTVNVTRVSGDLDLTVAVGASLTFTPANWDVWQTVTLAAAEDADTRFGMANFEVGELGYVAGAVVVNVFEVDNDATGASALWTWGANDYGQLGDGTRTTRLSPVRVFRDIVSVAGGLSHSVAVDLTGKVWSWGWNYMGTLGVGDLEALKLQPTLANITNVTVVDADNVRNSYFPTLALKTDGTVWKTQNSCPSCITFIPQSGLSDIIGIGSGGTLGVAL